MILFWVDRGLFQRWLTMSYVNEAFLLTVLLLKGGFLLMMMPRAIGRSCLEGFPWKIYPLQMERVGEKPLLEPILGYRRAIQTYILVTFTQTESPAATWASSQAHCHGLFCITVWHVIMFCPLSLLPAAPSGPQRPRIERLPGKHPCFQRGPIMRICSSGNWFVTAGIAPSFYISRGPARPCHTANMDVLSQENANVLSNTIHRDPGLSILGVISLHLPPLSLCLLFTLSFTMCLLRNPSLFFFH